MVDGGIIANFPIDVFNKKKYYKNSINFSTDDSNNNFVFNNEALGIRLDNDIQIQYDKFGKGIAPCEIDGFKTYIAALYNMILENLNRCNLKEIDWSRTISVSTLGIDPKMRRLSKKRKGQINRKWKERSNRFLYTKLKIEHVNFGVHTDLNTCTVPV